MESKIVGASANRQVRLLLVVLTALITLLAAGYYLFIRADYSILFADVRAADASAIVSELKSKDIPYRLRDGGSTILVRSDEAASARLAIAGSDLPQRGIVGFELFNESDMGLTDFAQRINYQRALQGELARTIIMMEGIESARVHLAMPERSLFRGSRAQPKAAVTVTTRRGGAIDQSRVAGIQRLVAAAVPDLALGDVVVLDNLGRLISAAAPAESALPPEMEEDAAVRQYFRARARSAVENALPQLEFDVRVVALARADSSTVNDSNSDWPGGGGAGSAAEPAGGGARARNFRLRMLIVTAAALEAPDQAIARNAVAAAVGLDERSGDSLAFVVAPLDPVAAPPAPTAMPLVGESGAVRAPAGGALQPENWWWVLASLAALLAGALVYRGRTRAMPNDEREAFVARIRHHLNLEEETSDARA